MVLKSLSLVARKAGYLQASLVLLSSSVLCHLRRGSKVASNEELVTVTSKQLLLTLDLLKQLLFTLDSLSFTNVRRNGSCMWSTPNACAYLDKPASACAALGGT